MRKLTEVERIDFLAAKEVFENYIERATTSSQYGELAKYQVIKIETLLKKSA